MIKSEQVNTSEKKERAAVRKEDHLHTTVHSCSTCPGGSRVLAVLSTKLKQ